MAARSARARAAGLWRRDSGSECRCRVGQVSSSKSAWAGRRAGEPSGSLLADSVSTNADGDRLLTLHHCRWPDRARAWGRRTRRRGASPGCLLERGDRADREWLLRAPAPAAGRCGSRPLTPTRKGRPRTLRARAPQPSRHATSAAAVRGHPQVLPAASWYFARSFGSDLARFVVPPSSPRSLAVMP